MFGFVQGPEWPLYIIHYFTYQLIALPELIGISGFIISIQLFFALNQTLPAAQIRIAPEQNELVHARSEVCETARNLISLNEFAVTPPLRAHSSVG
ncbi:hypothetical protein [Alloacidobacterium sp.]|uniref:hypothetical protein n=1 Tax=Alloacidobacterium sp. TaxID=2951999 RepID=UPI002D778D06|nr:hypothetical protein [Alloacidobacterium sp.]